MATVEEVMEEVRRKASEREEGLRDITSDAYREYTNAASRSATAESNFMQNEDAMNRARAAARAAAKEKAALKKQEEDEIARGKEKTNDIAERLKIEETVRKRNEVRKRDLDKEIFQNKIEAKQRKDQSRELREIATIRKNEADIKRKAYEETKKQHTDHRRNSKDELSSLQKQSKQLESIYKYKTAIGKELSKHAMGDVLRGNKVRGALGMVGAGLADVGVGGIQDATSFMTSGVTGGIGGAMNSAAKMATGLATGGLNLAGKGIGSFFGPGGAAIGGAVGDSIGAVLGGMISNAVAVEMFNMQKGAISRQQMGIVGRIGGIDRGTSAGRMMGGSLSSEEATQMYQGLASHGIDATSHGISARQTKVYAGNMRFWGESVNQTLADMIQTTGDYQSSLEDVNRLYITSRSGAKNLNIEIGKMAQMYAAVGKAARFMGVDAEYAKGWLQQMVSGSDGKARIESLRNVGVSDIGAGISNLIGLPRKLPPALQYYFASHGGKKQTDVMTAMFEAQYGSAEGYKYDDKTKSATFGGGMSLEYIKGMKSVFTDLYQNFLKTNNGDHKAAMVQAGMTAEAMGVNSDVYKLIQATPEKAMDSKFVEEVGLAQERDPVQYLRKLATFAADNEAFQSRLAKLSSELNPMVGHIYESINKIIDIMDPQGEKISSLENYKDRVESKGTKGLEETSMTVVENMGKSSSGLLRVATDKKYTLDQWKKEVDLRNSKLMYEASSSTRSYMKATPWGPKQDITIYEDFLREGRKPFVKPSKYDTSALPASVQSGIKTSSRSSEDFLREGRKSLVKPSKYDTSALPAGVQSGIKTSSRSSENSLIPAEIKSTGNMVALVIPQSSFDDIYKISKKRTS